MRLVVMVIELVRDDFQRLEQEIVFKISIQKDNKEVPEIIC